MLCKQKRRKMSFPPSHLGNGTDADAVDEGTLKNLAFLHEGHTQRVKTEERRGKSFFKD